MVSAAQTPVHVFYVTLFILNFLYYSQLHSAFTENLPFAKHCIVLSIQENQRFGKIWSSQVGISALSKEENMNLIF